MKRMLIPCAAAAVLLLALLTGCGKSSDKNTGVSPAPTQTVTPDKNDAMDGGGAGGTNDPDALFPEQNDDTGILPDRNDQNNSTNHNNGTDPDRTDPDNAHDDILDDAGDAVGDMATRAGDAIRDAARDAKNALTGK